ncbi:flagellar hook-basal body complex protein [Actibacterium sp. 188UL27-1]|uniref:flagellar hook-basal body complex protein n=1 Tax=Actibacterium sp. 188UL27-1 TaxID=2786961 RepID=UPI00195EC90C|nr:flagellar hook-basal body complex protein [Actibacterium sp. 188UL27-1]MBM7066208.1 flagellar hook-basal body complex protein [Actibacterium sp. 188UL27-1]
MMSTGYVTLTRQVGLMREMQSVANNLANMSTTGFRKEGVIFSEVIRGVDGPAGSVSMGAARVRHTDLQQGSLTATGGRFDFAIEGDGFFMVATSEGERLTRAGVFTPNEASELVNPDGHALLDLGGAPVFVPPDARSVALSSDGTLSADGRPLTQIGVFVPSDRNDLQRESGTLFSAKNGVEPAPNARLMQGFVEGSNVNPLLEITRMIEVQRSYELGQSFRDKESERTSKMIETIVG